ncbi:thiamine biosynthesis/tRNA modification protein ThiI [Teredinibacter turnerae T7901]|uniref:tRNA sulfurtransferase n=1 Tax=Teredinibacter turnerae (strain ATCC 39867 / T7901) TaxID=377629 RepID=C5BJ18_TERTT|nr:tRNA uracil 4-sulfurtransferase ThiI [Teredinibacter turnerae]ACR13621.1 thiamine biosynthesis/tRNA modification protein ThiI [Teredinibacter turnerae T7901]
MIFTVRLFPEITIKSHPVRKRWTRQLTENLRLLGRRIHEGTKVIQDWDRIEVRVPDDDDAVQAQFIDMLKRTPGISTFSLVSAYPFTTLHDIYEHALPLYGDLIANKTFCVRVKRTGKHDFTSTDAEKYVGGGLNQHTQALGVRLKDPDVTVHIDIKDDYCYLVNGRFAGLGGFPMGTQDPVLSLVSGGFDSTVASYLMMKRGLRTHFCFFNLGGRDHELGVKEIAFYLWNRYSASHRVRFVTVPFEGVVEEILEKIDPANMGVVLKRMMLRAAEKIAARGDIQALVTGEAVAQVSSQTIPNLSAIERVCNTLVLRPLIAMDKPEIIRLSREIGAEEFSANIPEYCGVISVKPSAKVRLDRLEAQEAQFDFSRLENAIEQSRVQPIDAVMEDLRNPQAEVEAVAQLQPGDRIIDIRHPTEIDMRPLALPADTDAALEIPFYSLSTRFAELAREGRYLLYCDKGVMSQLHARHLRDDGATNVAVYRPEKPV